MQVGGIRVDAISDGTFTVHPKYFGADVPAGARPEFFARDHLAWMPIGCFLVRAGDRTILVDAGMGPDQDELPHGMRLVGGQLFAGLGALGVGAADITDVVITHFHTDHIGWLFDLAAEPVFPNAELWYGAADFEYFVTGPGDIRPHLRDGFLTHRSRQHSLTQHAVVTPGVTAVLTPGHTPGHLCVSLASGNESLLLLGDAITCPIQLAEPTWHSFGDVDAPTADRTRRSLWQQLRTTPGVGAHFPSLTTGKVNAATEWVAD
ncbi:MBL fold metallo-hydrolase [Kribbella sp. CA-293567]|uniref:MBL fold metallo-hydrolase n=1 Tax=Kribbella sp. CA-293567 TaxID=3002436 RepID=UPI0022DDB7E9|nr:MBL fold metallo-hydrolase [Kribbella sp. CA-293567]WBQ05074.1 MBL fold metallo-hydrolase [Kribbella sp. CA-293567]